ncbi:MAG: DUF4124 domain-containing protein [Burkholderiales bacterium]|nr:DUF4124 domain-containing protein [Burkholderiales bacterium]
MVRNSVFRTVMTAAAAVLLLVSLPAEAQWKWKDKGGRIQYSDLPPPAGTPDQDILSRPSAPRRASITAPAASQASAPALVAGASAPSAPRAVDPEFEAKRKKAESENLAKNKAEEERIAAAKADNCGRARAQLRTFESGIRVTRTNEKGEREFLDDKQRADETKHAKDVIAADCSK